MTQFCIVKSQDEYFVTSLGHGVIRVSVVERKPVHLVGFVVNASFLVRHHLYANHVSFNSDKGRNSKYILQKVRHCTFSISKLSGFTLQTTSLYQHLRYRQRHYTSFMLQTMSLYQPLRYRLRHYTQLYLTDYVIMPRFTLQITLLYQP